MPAYPESPLAPGVFCQALRQWVATGPAADVAPPLQAASDVAWRVGGDTDRATFERQLVRLASYEAPGVAPDTAAGAQLVLQLWRTFGTSTGE